VIEEHKLHEQMQRGAASEAALRELGTAFDDVKAEIARAWMESPPRDDAGREKLWLATTLLTRVETVLRNRAANGQVAKAELESLRRTGERKVLNLF
jgi:hypothetical protein